MKKRRGRGRRGAGGRGGGWEHGLVVEHLPGMCEVPESIPGIKKQTTKTLKVDLKSWKRSKPISKESEKPVGKLQRQSWTKGKAFL